MAIDPPIRFVTEADESAFSKFHNEQCIAITRWRWPIHGHLTAGQDDNIVQSVQQARPAQIDHWNFRRATYAKKLPKRRCFSAAAPVRLNLPLNATGTTNDRAGL
jgi:hypothetical protein